MYPNLKAEMARYRVSVGDIAEACGKTISPIYAKMRGDAEFRLSDMETILHFMEEKAGREFTLEYLFERDGI